MRPTARVNEAIDAVDPTGRGTIYSLLGTFNQALQTALDNGGGDAYRNVIQECLADVTQIVIEPAVTGRTDWEYVMEIAEAYPATETDHHIHTVVVNAIGAGILHTRFTEGIEHVPVEPAEYLVAVGREHPSDFAWEDAFAIGWYADHPEYELLEVFDELLATQEQFVLGALRSTFQADQAVGADALKLCVEHPESVETVMPFEAIKAIQDSRRPQSPRYHAPREHYPVSTALDSEVATDLEAFAEEQGLLNALEHHGLLPTEIAGE